MAEKPFHKKDVKIGAFYTARVGNDRFAVIRIDCACERGGWDATNLNTNRAIHIKSAAKLKREVTPSDIEERNM